MSTLKYKIISYSENYENALLALEKNAPQGKMIQIEMIKESFKRRSENFEKHHIYLAVDLKGKLLGALAASIVPIVINGKKSDVGYCYDVRVAQHARGHGLTKKMGKHAYDNFYLPNKISKVFLTMKKGNLAVHKSAGILGFKLYKYAFSYLTVPTNKRLKRNGRNNSSEKLTITTQLNSKKLEPFFYAINGEPSVWKIDLIYNLKIRKLHFSIKFINYVLSHFQSKSKQLPKEGDELHFGILMYHSLPTKEGINSILAHLQEQGIGYLLVACTRNSNLYSLLKPIAINCYAYEICSTFPINQNDSITLDVRCL